MSAKPFRFMVHDILRICRLLTYFLVRFFKVQTTLQKSHWQKMKLFLWKYFFLSCLDSHSIFPPYPISFRSPFFCLLARWYLKKVTRTYYSRSNFKGCWYISKIREVPLKASIAAPTLTNFSLLNLRTRGYRKYR